MNKSRLQNLSTHLRTLPPEKRDFDKIISDCGTCGCAIGQLPNVDPDNCKYVRQVMSGHVKVYINDNIIHCSSDHKLEEYFGIPQQDVRKIFLSHYEYAEKYGNLVSRVEYVTATMVADEIDEYVRSHE